MPNWIVHIGADLILFGAAYLISPSVRTKWPQAILGLVSSNLIDIDHLLADPVYVPDRCSVTTHPLHRWFAIPFYMLMFLFKNVFVRFFAAGALLHIALDAIDCLL